MLLDNNARENVLDWDGRDLLLPLLVATILDPNQQFINCT